MSKAKRLLALCLALVMMLSIPLVVNGAVTEYQATDNYETVVSTPNNPYALPLGTWKAGSNKVQSLVDIPAVKNNIKSDAGYRYLAGSTTNNSYGAAINGPYKKSDQGFTLRASSEYNGVKYTKGFGTHPKANQAPATISLDISAYTSTSGNYKYDTFYSAVGLTNLASKGVYFLVYADDKLVASSNAITGDTMGEFNVNVSGVKTLKLVVITSTEDNSSSACAWISPCLFKADSGATKPAKPVMPNYEEEAPEKLESTDNYVTVVTAPTNPHALPYGTWQAGKNKVYSLMKLPCVKDNIVKGDEYDYLKGSTSSHSKGYGAAINGPYKKSHEGFTLRKSSDYDGIKYLEGFGTHPKAGQGPAVITLDISEYTNTKGTYQCDTFYAVVGLTNLASKGVYFQVYADDKLVANSEAIIGDTLGEFNVNVSGVKTLKLVVVSSTSDHSSSACAWINPCLFKKDSTAEKPNKPVVPDPNDDGSIKFDVTDNFEEVKWSDENRDTRPYGPWMSGKNPVISLIDTLPAEKIAQTTGEATNYAYYIDSNSLNGFGASINGPYKKSGAGYTVGGNVNFFKGFGTHPLPSQQEVYINLDVSKFTDPNGEYQCDTFYSCVGLTNTASNGVYFQVFADYGDGVYMQIANSTSIIMQNLGEFNVDITGVKNLRLVVISSTMAHGSSASAWLNPCVFKADPDAKKTSYVEYDPSEEYEKEPIVDAPLFVKPAETAKSKIGLIIGIVAGVVVVAGAAVAVIVILRKKKQSGAEE